MSDVVCEKCGKVLEIGLFPFCPHEPGAGYRQRDEIPGGIVLENYGAQPMRFDSHSERRAYMKAQGLEEREKFAPLPGTDRDPAGIPNPKGYVDPYTLEAGRILMLRAAGCLTEEFDAHSSGVLRGDFNVVGDDAAAVAVQTNTDKYRQSRLARRLSGGHTGS